MDLHGAHGEGSPAFGQRRRRPRRPDLARPGVRRPGYVAMGELWRGVVGLWPRLAITVICLAFWRILAAIPLPVAGLTDLRLSSGRPFADGGLFPILGNPMEPESLVALGLTPFLDAFVILWLWAAGTGNLRKLQTDERWMWRSLAWLTAGLALARAFGLILLFPGGRPAVLTSTPGLLGILGLPLRPLGLPRPGRPLLRFGGPAG